MINDYTSLKAAVVSYMKRQDLDAEVETFIQLAEGSLNNNPEFRVREMSHSSTYISKDGLVPFYDDYLSLRSIRNTGGNALSLASPAIMAQSDGCSTCPRFYREEGRQLHISPVVDYVSLDITYYEKLPALSDINTTNWLLLKAPNIYLYGALIESTALVMNDERIGLWKSRYDEAVRQLIDADQGDRWSGSPTSVRLHDESTSCITDEESYVPPGELPGAPKFILLMPDLISDLNILYSYNVTSHFSGDVASYALYDAPTWLTMDAETGVMSGVPNAGALLTGLTVAATNAYGTVISNEFDMRVLAVPSGPPRYDALTTPFLYDLHCNVDIAYTYDAAYHFAVGGAVAAYSLNNAPSWMSIDSVTGRMAGTPLATEPATDVSITATNTKGSDTSPTFNVLTLDEIIPAKFWKVVSEGSWHKTATYFSLAIAEVGLMDVPNGVTITTGGVAFEENENPSEGYPPSKAFDGGYDVQSKWGPFPTQYAYDDHDIAIGYEFASAESPVELELSTVSDAGWATYMPRRWRLQYSTDGVTYRSIITVADQAAWAIAERKYFNILKRV